ncbi:hypothetical protein [Anabaena azotica]|uniref:Uncharacterized protein n=1 Tax=Anabaena azotica FACHB-119 TaxID=947527 RepID=A0ABR8DA21_9NOST|nr:hypothetical protein [Anabaena azotica]MBD2503426.1 hypothetical protein [Anabaena azotica FACHB-119]
MTKRKPKRLIHYSPERRQTHAACGYWARPSETTQHTEYVDCPECRAYIKQQTTINNQHKN